MSFGLMIQEPNVSWLLNTTFCGSFHVSTCLKNTCENPKPREKDFVAPLPGLCAHSQNLLCPRCHRDRIIMSFKAFNSCSDFFLHDLFPFSLLHPQQYFWAGGSGMNWQMPLSVNKAGKNLGSCPGGRVPAPKHIPPLWWVPVGFLGSLQRQLHAQDGAQVTCEIQATHLLSVQHSSPVGLFTAQLLPHIVAKSEQTHSSAAQAHLWEGWYVESSPAGSGMLQGAQGEQAVVFHRARAGSTAAAAPGPP